MLDTITKIDFDAITKSVELLNDDPEEPKTLQEIADKVGFPFVAKAVLEGNDGPELGCVLTFIGKIETTGIFLHPTLNQKARAKPELLGQFMIVERVNETVAPTIKRWVLVK